MRTIKAVDVPTVQVQKTLHGYNETPSLEHFTIRVYDGDFDAEELGAPSEALISTIDLVVMNPKKGNVVQQADMDSAEYWDVARCFFESSGRHLNPKAEQNGAHCYDNGKAVPLMYIEKIQTRKEFESTGQDVLGAAIGLAEIAQQYAMGPSDELKMMLATCQKQTLFVGTGENFAASTDVDLDERWMKNLGIDGIWTTWEGANVLLGTAAWDAGYKVKALARTDEQLQHHVDTLNAIKNKTPMPAPLQPIPTLGAVAGKLKQKAQSNPSATQGTKPSGPVV